MPSLLLALLLFLLSTTPASAQLFPPVIIDETINSPPNSESTQIPQSHDDPNHDFHSNTLDQSFTCEIDLNYGSGSGQNPGAGELELQQVDLGIETVKLTNNFGRLFSQTGIGRGFPKVVESLTDKSAIKQQYQGFQTGAALQFSSLEDQKLFKSNYFTDLIPSLNGSDQVAVDETQAWACGSQAYDIDHFKDQTPPSSCRPITTAEIAYAFLQSGKSPFYELNEETGEIEPKPFPGDLASVLTSYFPSKYNSDHPNYASFQLIGDTKVYDTLYDYLNLVPRTSLMHKVEIKHTLSFFDKTLPRNVEFDGASASTFNGSLDQLRPYNQKDLDLKTDFCAVTHKPEKVDRPAPLTGLKAIIAAIKDAAGKIISIISVPEKIVYTYDKRLPTGILKYENTMANFIPQNLHDKYKLTDSSQPQASAKDSQYPRDPHRLAEKYGNIAQFGLLPQTWKDKLPASYQVDMSVDSVDSTANNSVPTPSPKPSPTPTPTPRPTHISPTPKPSGASDENACTDNPSTNPAVNDYLKCFGVDPSQKGLFGEYLYNTLCEAENRDWVVEQSLAAGINPLLSLTLWLHESNAGSYAGAAQFGVVRDDVSRSDINAQWNAFKTLPQSFVNECQSMYPNSSSMDVFLGRFSTKTYADRCKDPTQYYDNEQEGKAYVDNINKFYNSISAKDASGNPVCNFPSSPFTN